MKARDGAVRGRTSGPVQRCPFFIRVPKKFSCFGVCCHHNPHALRRTAMASFDRRGGSKVVPRGSDFHTDVDEECCWCGKPDFATEGVQALSIISCECCRNAYIHLGCLVRFRGGGTQRRVKSTFSCLASFKRLCPLFSTSCLRQRRLALPSSRQKTSLTSSSGAAQRAARTCGVGLPLKQHKKSLAENQAVNAMTVNTRLPPARRMQVLEKIAEETNAPPAPVADAPQNVTFQGASKARGPCMLPLPEMDACDAVFRLQAAVLAPATQQRKGMPNELYSSFAVLTSREVRRAGQVDKERSLQRSGALRAVLLLTAGSRSKRLAEEQCFSVVDACCSSFFSTLKTGDLSRLLWRNGAAGRALHVRSIHQPPCMLRC